MTTPFNLAADLPPNGTLIQASAGTGKTYTVAAIITLALAEDPDLRIGNVLVTTYTRAAAAELKHRIRSRIAATARLLRGGPALPGGTSDELDVRLLANESDRPAKARRLERALAEFDTATIGTIHSVCAAVLRMAGTPMSAAGEEDARKKVVDEVVNDAIVAATAQRGAAGQPQGLAWNESGLQKLVSEQIADPFIEPWYDEQGMTAEQVVALKLAAQTVKDCAARVQERMRATPSFDDSLRLARDEIKGDDAKQKSFRESLQAKYRLAIVDEAQDTNRLQWEFLQLLFPPDEQASAQAGDTRKPAVVRRLLAVGDPKQAIYTFRGGDVAAYLRFAQGGGLQGGVRPPAKTLGVNYRSDGPLLSGLNVAMANATFGEGIPYERVAPEKNRTASRLHGVHPVEFLDVGTASLEDVAVMRVHELLTTPCFLDGAPRPFRPKEICVVCRLNNVGMAIAARLRRLHIPAVTTGTANVMKGQTAEDLRVLLEAMAKPSDAGLARRAAATVFFGRPLTEEVRLTDEDVQDIQEQIAGWSATLQRKGVAAMAGGMMAAAAVAKRLASGPEGERRVVDFGHVVELLHDRSQGRGIPARMMLEHVADLAVLQDTHEAVSRRVETDEDAVRIMTIHAAKGLEFPAVIVVDMWSEADPDRQRGANVFYEGDSRRLDVGLAYAEIGSSHYSKQRVAAAINDDRRRLIYVAATRPQHHLSVVRSAAWETSLLKLALPGAPMTAADVPAEEQTNIAVRVATELPRAATWNAAAHAQPQDKQRPEKPDPEAEKRDTPCTAPLPAKVEQVYRRTSFSTLVGLATRQTENHHAPLGHGHDETSANENDEELSAANAVPDAVGGVSDAAEPPAAAPAGLDRFTMADLPGGTAFGTTVHDIFEHLDLTGAESPAHVTAAVRKLVERMAASRSLRDRHGILTDMIVAALHTPFGGPPTAMFRNLRLIDFAKGSRLVEMDFEMGMADLEKGVLASDVGRVLRAALEDRPDDPLRSYAELLAGESFDVPLAGLINGQIDAVLRLPDAGPDDPRLLIVDYKTNTLHGTDDAVPLAAYSVRGMAAEMAHAHYPLQALVYGTAVWRMLRWRLGPRKPAGWDPSECMAGIVYAFVRGMKGPDTPVDVGGRRYGVFPWQPPGTIWKDLSNLLAGDLTGVRE